MKKMKYEVRFLVLDAQGRILEIINKQLFNYEFLEIAEIVAQLQQKYKTNRIRAEFRAEVK